MYVAVHEDSGAVIRIPNNLFFQKMFKVIDRRAPSIFEGIEPRHAVVHERHPG